MCSKSTKNHNTDSTRQSAPFPGEMLRSHSFPHNVQRSQSNCVWFQWSCYWHSHLHSKQLSPVETSRRSLICCGGVSLCHFIKCVYAVCFPLLFARDGIRYRLMIVVVRSNASHMTWAVFVSFHPRVIWAGHVRVGGGQRFFFGNFQRLI